MNLNNPHDKLLKAILSDKTLAADYFTHFLPANIAGQIDFDTLQLSSASYIDENLKESFADLVFDCTIKTDGEPIEIALLLEHKSYVDQYAPFQILYYTAAAWMQRIANKQPPRAVIPTLLYHGKEPWDYTTIEDYFANLPKGLNAFLPKFDFVFNNLQAVADDQLWHITNQFLAANFLALKHYFDQQWLENNLRVLFAQSLEGKSKLNWQFHVYVLNFVKLKKQEIMELLLTLPTDQKTDILSTYDQLIEEGMQKGLEKGLQQGMQKGQRAQKVQSVIASFKNGLELSLIAKITQLSSDEVEQILRDQQLV